MLLSRNIHLFSVKQKALVTIEIGCMVAVIFITIMIVAGKAVHQVTLDREFITLFSVIRDTLDKVIAALYYVYSALINAIHPETLQNMVMVPVEFVGNAIGRKARETRERLAIAEEERRKADEHRQALELELQALENERQAEKQRQAREKARQEREKMEQEAREKERREAEETRARELEREKELEKERQKLAQDKARKEKTLHAVEKKEKDRITNAIRYQFKRLQALDARKEPTKYAECKTKINEIIADKISGLAFLESRGYNCSVDWETGSVSATEK